MHPYTAATRPTASLRCCCKIGLSDPVGALLAVLVLHPFITSKRLHHCCTSFCCTLASFVGPVRASGCPAGAVSAAPIHHP
eukprot:1154164-Pelagomonas_calceolata.AAC.4